MTVPVRDVLDRHVGWMAIGGYVGPYPVHSAPPEMLRREYIFGGFECVPWGRGFCETRWLRLDPMHPWDLDPHMNYEPLGYRKMTEGDL